MIRLDFEKIDINSVLEYYNIRNIAKRGDEFQFSCPFPEHKRGDRNPSASINSKNGLYNCFSCGRKGNLITFVAELDSTNLAQAAKSLRDAYGGEYENKNSLQAQVEKLTQLKPTIETERILPEEYISIFYVDWEAAYEAYKDRKLPRKLRQPFDRGFTPSVLFEWGIGYDPKSRRISIPYRNEYGKLVGFKGRATKRYDKPRYLGIGDRGDSKYYGFTTVKTSEYVFGVDSASGTAIIVEGELDTISLRQRGFKNAISVGGSNISHKQIAIIRSKFDRVYTLFDPDEAGRKAERFLAKHLLQSIPVSIARLDQSDPADSSTEEIHKAIEQAQNAIEIT